VSTLLVFGACKKKDAESAANVAENSGEKVKGALGLSSDPVSAADLNKHFKTKPRKTGTQSQALKKLGLDAPSDALSWKNKSDKNGNVSYQNLTYNGSGDGSYTVKEMEFIGLEMVNDEATFDNMILKGVKIIDDGDTTTIKSLKFADPHPKIAARIMSGINDLDGLEDLDMDVDLDGEIPFGAMLLEGLSHTGAESTSTLKSAGWAIDEKSGKGSFLLSGLTAESSSDKGTPFNVSLDTVSASGISEEFIQSLSKSDMGSGDPGESFDMMRGGFGEFLIRDVKVDADDLKLNFVGLEASSKKSGNVSNERMVMKPLSISFDGPGNDPNMQSAREAFTKLGMDKLVFTGEYTGRRDTAKDEIEIKDSFVRLKDGFDINYSGKMSGTKAAQENPAAAKIHNMSIKLREHDFLDRAFAIGAAEFGMGAKEARQQVAGLVSMAGLMGQAPTSITNPVAKFVTDGGSLQISMNPDAPVSSESFLSISGPDDLERLGVTVKHKK